MKIFTKIFLSILVFWGVFSLQTVRADSFTVSGVLQMTDPANNPYLANYVVKTPSGSKFYFKLNKAFYGDWVEKKVYFHVNGDFHDFVVKSSGMGVRNNTYKIPETGSDLAVMILVSTIFAGFVANQKLNIKYQIFKSKFKKINSQY